MTSDQNVATKGQRTEATQRESAQVLRPAVDIYENGESIKLFADLPGVSQSNLQVEVDDKTLTIQGDVALDMPSDIESAYADVRATHYQRAFTLSSELDTANINASLTNGLLTVTIPKREEVRPRKIEVSAA